MTTLQGIPAVDTTLPYKDPPLEVVEIEWFILFQWILKNNIE